MTDNTHIQKFGEEDLEAFTQVLYDLEGIEKPTKPNWRAHIPEGHTEEELEEFEAARDAWLDAPRSRPKSKPEMPEAEEGYKAARAEAMKADDRVADEDRAAEIAERIFNHIRTRPDYVGLVFYNTWWASEKLHEWEHVWTAKMEAESEKAVCVRDAVPKSDWHEDEYFTHRVTEATWLPKTSVFVFDVVKPEREDALVVSPGQVAKRGKPSEADIVLKNLDHTSYGYKLHVESPFEAKDAIKGLDWERTHRAWDKDARVWTVDAEAARRVVNQLNSEGFSVAIPAHVEAAMGSYDLPPRFDDIEGYTEA